MSNHVLSRSIVWFAALLIAVFSIVDLSECNGRALCFVLNVAIIVAAVLGVIGAWRNDKGLLGYFILLVFCLIAFEVGWVIWAFAENYRVRTVVWNFVLSQWRRDMLEGCSRGGRA